jgi:ATP-dependent helicase/DNAse subunit B
MLNLDFVFANDPTKIIEIKGSKDISHKLLENNSEGHPLSPSAINTYLHCSLKFYLRYVVNLPEPDEVKEEIDGVVFGNIFHDTLEELYKPFIGKVVNKIDLENMLKDRVHMENEVTQQIAIHYLKKKKPIKGPIKLQGKTLLIFENAIIYLKGLLKVDLAIAPFTIVSLEEKYKRWIKLNIDAKETQICIGGKIDRVDKINGQVRVLDYKTGNVKGLGFNNVEDLFDKTIKEPKKEILQALIYCWGLSRSLENSAVLPAIYSLRDLFKDNFSPNIKLNKKDMLFDDVKDDFEDNLKQLVAEIYSEQNVFVQTEHVDKCKYCAYRGICKRF